MSRYDEGPQWIYWFPYLAMMCSFTALAVGLAVGESWYYLLLAAVGITTTGTAWRTNQITRERIKIANRQIAYDRTRIADLETKLAKARAWQN